MHERFHYKTKEELTGKASDLGSALPYSDDISPLLVPANAGGFKIGNRLVVQPMEGYDSGSDGSPTELTKRRYLRYANGASGIIWFEAVSVNPEGRSNPRQLWLHKKNRDSFSYLNDEIKNTAAAIGSDPLLIAQLTHSGRYSKPYGVPKPQVAAANSILDKIPPSILEDDDLKRIQDQFVESSRLAYASGFGAVDLKACHGYLMVDLLAARDRENSIFGGRETEKRFRFLLETYDRIRYEVPGILVTVRLNISDLYPGGFGTKENGEADFEESLLLVEQLASRGIEIINISMGSPYHNPHVSRPYDTPVPGASVPAEHPLQGVSRMIRGTSIFQKKYPGIQFVGSAYSYLRHFGPNVGAAVVRNGDASFIGFGRSSFAYPSMPLDLMNEGKADPSKICITCSGCTRLIRNLRPGGCVLRDRLIYANELKKLISDGK